jgi:cytochrome c oxidase assembly protein subunit 15
LSGVAISTAAMAYVLIIFGSQVRVSDSGMGCPDCPLCDGKLGPSQEFHALMEQTHRYLAAVVTLLVLATALLARRQRSRSAAIRPALFTVGVIAVQIGLGALTVIDSNGAPTVAAHLLAGLTMLAGATVTAICTLVPMRATVGRRLRPLGWAAVAPAGVLFVSGSLVVNADAQKSCASFPLCPPDQLGGLVALNVVHVLAGAALLTFAVHAWRRWSALAGARALGAMLIALVMATASLGIVSALLKAPPGWQDLHLAGAAAVLAVSVALAALGWLTGADAPRDGGPEAGLPMPAPSEASNRARQ